ncbi:MAG: membrane protein insertase YidC, partial [Bacteroidetes bacterium]|nr:membrane protein insertase YidC [Bacteroidota bacterium]
DRNSIIGIILIGFLIIAYSLYTQPSAEEQLVMKHRQDSITAVMKAEEKQKEIAQQQKSVVTKDTSLIVAADINDSAKQEIRKQQFGDFASAADGTEKFFTLENSRLKITISNKGGRITNAELKNYKTFDGKPVALMNSDSADFGLSLSAQNRIIRTNTLFFAEAGDVSPNHVTLRVSAGNNRYIEYSYALDSMDYMVKFKIDVVGMSDLVAASYLSLDWKQPITKQEKTMQSERMATTVYYRFSGEDEDVDYISESKDEQQSLKTKVKWIAFKQQYFTSVLIADNSFDSPTVESRTDKNSEKYVKTLSTSIALPFEHKASESYGMRFYIGPNHYQTLKKTGDLKLEKQIPLGWGIFGWVNRFLVIPTFNFLNGFHLNFGIIILILTILIRIVLLPLTYGSFKSQAKMKVLQPEIAEITAKFPDDAMKKQQETMSLYRKAGVNPLGGCIPGLLQMPILIAMFRFFPSSIELRGEHFLWAKDLSTYDSILDLPFKIPFYGDHVSLFTLLMTVSTLLYTRMNMQMTSAANPQMKWMMYLMPIMFLGVFNNYSAGLSYYYFLSNIFGFGQQYLFKAFIDEDAIHRQIQENKKRPKIQKKSSFQERLEKMAKERGYQPKKK